MLAHYFLFLAKTLTIVIALLLLLAGILILISRGKAKSKDKIEIKKINARYHHYEQELLDIIRDKQLRKKQLKAEKKQLKALQAEKHKKIFVLNFIGDIRASSVKNLREEITAILTVAQPTDEVVLKLESPGGLVPAYGLAASQLQRLRQRQIPLTVIIDKVAASGGYMMACVANHILAAPFAIIGSIGVIAQMPNFHRWLKKKDIDWEQIMAGQYKRTLTLFGENTSEAREKFQAEVNDTQTLFKSFVVENRPVLDIDQVATGEHWYGARAIELKLIDDIITSDDYLQKASKEADIYEICYHSKKALLNKFAHAAQQSLSWL
ncbi:MAG: protease SohB [Gammaproteobacteria bacterium]